MVAFMSFLVSDTVCCEGKSGEKKAPRLSGRGAFRGVLDENA